MTIDESMEFIQTPWFTLRDDGDSAVRRILYGGTEDVSVYSVHNIEDNGNWKDVDCHGEGCPMCREGLKPMARIYIPLYDDTNETYEFWIRGAMYIRVIRNLIGEHGSLVNRRFEIIRHGAAGDMKTTYELVPLAKTPDDDVTMENFADRPSPVGIVLNEWSVEKMERWLNPEPVQYTPRGSVADDGDEL
jgi:hypothetical protein